MLARKSDLQSFGNSDFFGGTAGRVEACAGGGAGSPWELLLLAAVQAHPQVTITAQKLVRRTQDSVRGPHNSLKKTQESGLVQRDSGFCQKDLGLSHENLGFSQKYSGFSQQESRSRQKDSEFSQCD